MLWIARVKQKALNTFARIISPGYICLNGAENKHNHSHLLLTGLYGNSAFPQELLCNIHYKHIVGPREKFVVKCLFTLNLIKSFLLLSMPPLSRIYNTLPP